MEENLLDRDSQMTSNQAEDIEDYMQLGRGQKGKRQVNESSMD